MPLMRFVDRLSALTGLDPLAQNLSGLANKLPAVARDALHGVWLGHPLHPVVAQVPVGAWVSASLLDAVALAVPSTDPARPGLDRAAAALVGAGLGAAPAAALPGFADWSALHPEQQRIGLVHASANVVAAGMMAASLRERRRGRQTSGRLWAFAGLMSASLGAAIGGHLSYRYASGANHAEEVPHVTTSQWVELGRVETFEERTPTAGRVGDTAVVVVRRGEQVDVLADACSHLSGPLSGGSVSTERGVDCIVCPWHGSAFALETGDVVHGPATSPQPAFDVQVVDGVVSARVRSPEAVARANGSGPAHRRLGTVV